MNARKIAAFSIGPIGGAALGFISVPIVAWFYSAEDIGRIAIFQIMSSFCILLFSLGLDQAYVREYHGAENKPELLKASLLPGLLLLTVGLLLCFVMPSFISKSLFDVDSVPISLLMAICFLAAFVSRFLSLILRMQEKGIAYSMSQVLPKLLFLIVIITYFLFSFSFDFLHLVIAHTISILAVTFIYTWNTRKEWLASIKIKIDIEKLKTLLRFGSPLIIGGAAFWGLTSMDKLFLRSLSTFEELGIYSIATSFAAIAIVFQSVFSTVWAPIVYKLAAEGINTNKIDNVTDGVLAAVVLLFSLAGLFSWIVTFILPPQYNHVQYLILPCMAYPLFYALSEATAIGIGVTRKTIYSMLASLITVIVNGIGNYLLVPKLGASGAAISTAISFWIFFFLRTEFSIKVWRPLPRVKLYTFTLICLTLSVMFTLYGDTHYQYFMTSFFTLLLILLFFYKKQITQFNLKSLRTERDAK